MRHFILHLLILLAPCAMAQPILPVITQVGLARLNASAKQHLRANELVQAVKGRFPVQLMHQQAMVGFLGRFDTGSPTPVPGPYIQWGARVGNVISFRIDAFHLDRLMTINGLHYAELATIKSPALDHAVRDIRADSVQQGLGLPSTFTGRNTILGIIDIGFDFTHPMFYDTAMTATRILAAWDHYKQSGSPPAGYGYGALYNGANELSAAQCDTIDPFGERSSHVTHVAGIAGGGGAGTPFRGVAFDAELLFVTIGMDDSAILDGITWMQQRADQEGKRLVVNASWGSRDGPLDGTSLFNQALDQITEQGVLFVCANGNFGGVTCHLGHAFTGDTIHTRAAFASSGSDPYYAGQSLLLWGDIGASFSASIACYSSSGTLSAASPWYNTAAGPLFLDTMLVSGVDTLFYSIAYEAAHPLNGRPYLQFKARRSNNGSQVALNMTASSGMVHAWNDMNYTVGPALGGMAFEAAQVGWTPGDRQFTVVEPACGHGVIGVGAYRAAYLNGAGAPAGGQLASFSSRGPTIDRRVKPDICAPGVAVASSISSFATTSHVPVTSVPFQGRVYPFGSMQGTSMATPMVTGAAALLFEMVPNATPAQVKQVLLDNAREDLFTGNIPDTGSTVWGAGKLNVHGAAIDLLGLVDIPEGNERTLSIWPNPATRIVHVQRAGQADKATYSVLDATGKIIATGTFTTGMTTLEVGTWARGAYLLIVKDKSSTFTRRLVLE